MVFSVATCSVGLFSVSFLDSPLMHHLSSDWTFTHLRIMSSDFPLEYYPALSSVDIVLTVHIRYQWIHYLSCHSIIVLLLLLAISFYHCFVPAGFNACTVLGVPLPRYTVYFICFSVCCAIPADYFSLHPSCRLDTLLCPVITALCLRT